MRDEIVASRNVMRGTLARFGRRLAVVMTVSVVWWCGECGVAGFRAAVKGLAEARTTVRPQPVVMRSRHAAGKRSGNLVRAYARLARGCRSPPFLPSSEEREIRANLGIRIDLPTSALTGRGRTLLLVTLRLKY